MALQVVGAGLGRTGTTSLKSALETLLGGRCYHMVEVFGRPEDSATWQRATEGELPDWSAFLDDYLAIVDWPGCAFWRELSAAFPDAIVLLSERDVDSWWTSANNTIFDVSRPAPAPGTPMEAQHRMVVSLFEHTFTPDWQDESSAKAAYVAHNERVRAEAPADRLVEWHPGDDWGPLCAALGLPEPDAPYPHVNTTDEFRQLTGLDQGV